MRTILGGTSVWFLLAGLAACGAAPGHEGDGKVPAERDNGLAALAKSDAVLAIGASGEAVGAVNRYLREFGYLPNADLQRAYPRWRSPVVASPEREDFYDDRTAEGVLALQQNVGLAQTGTVDAATRRVLLEARCGVPQIEDFDDSNKFDLYTGVLFGPVPRTWRLVNPNDDDELTQSQAETAIAAAFARWAAVTKLAFTKSTSGTADIEIRWSHLAPNGNPWSPSTLATTRYPEQGSDMWINTSFLWSVANPTPAGRFDFESLVMHELGHAFGLAHSSITALGVLYPVISAATQHRVLQPDDIVAGLLLNNDPWSAFDSASYDIDVDSGPTFSQINVTGDPPASGGHTVWRLENGEWSILAGQGALRLGSDGGILWIVQDDGDIYEWQNQTWNKRPGCAKDVAVGTDHSVWIVSCNTAFGAGGAPPTGYQVQKWNGSAFATATGNQGATRISVGPAAIGGANVPWIVSSSGKIYRRTSSSASSGSWTLLPAPSSGVGSDIAVSPTGNAWLIGTEPEVGGSRIYAWNEQSALNSGGPTPLAEFRWRGMMGGGVNVTVDHRGFPYVVNNAKTAFLVP